MFVAVATHKKINFNLKKGYNPVQINSSLSSKWKSYYHDSDGINIADKNYCYCELTAMYWLWKNIKTDIKGLCHYRRYFSNNDFLTMSEMDFCTGNKIKDKLLSEEMIKMILKKHDIIVVRPYRPYPVTEYEDLSIWCYEKDINVLRDVIAQNYPEYFSSFDKITKSKNLSHYNMMISSSEFFDSYCKWLFSVLADVENRTDIRNYDTQHKRIYGYMAEMLLNVYIERNNLKVNYKKVVEPIEFISMSRIKLYKINFIENIQKKFMCLHLFGIIEKIYRLVKTEKYNKYIALKKMMMK